MGRQVSVNDRTLLFLARLHLEHSKRPERHEKFFNNAPSDVQRLTREDFEEIDSRIGTFVKYYKYCLSNVEDFKNKSFKYPHEQAEKSAYKRYHLKQLENKIIGNGPTYLDLLKKHLKSGVYYSPNFPVGKPPKDSVGIENLYKLTPKEQRERDAYWASVKQKKNEQNESKPASKGLSAEFWGVVFAFGLFGYAIYHGITNPVDSGPSEYCNPATGVCVPMEVEERRRDKLKEDYKDLQDEIYRSING